LPGFDTSWQLIRAFRKLSSFSKFKCGWTLRFLDVPHERRLNCQNRRAWGFVAIYLATNSFFSGNKRCRFEQGIGRGLTQMTRMRGQRGLIGF
jgi:hypothetical protein